VTNLSHNDNEPQFFFTKEIGREVIAIMTRTGVIEDIFNIFDADGNLYKYIDPRLIDAIDTFDTVAYNLMEIYGDRIAAHKALYAINDNAPFNGRSIIDMVKENPYSIYEIQLYYNSFIAPYMPPLNWLHPEDKIKELSTIAIEIRTQREGGGDQSFEEFLAHRLIRLVSKKLSCLETILKIPVLPDGMVCNKYCEDSIWAINIVFPMDHTKGLVRKIMDACEVIITRVYYMKDMGLDFYLGKVIVDIDYNMVDGEVTLVMQKR
jgi:hypothetical protein